MITFLNLNQEKGDTWKFDKPGEYVVFFHNRSGKFTFDLAHKGVNVDIYGILPVRMPRIIRLRQCSIIQQGEQSQIY